MINTVISNFETRVKEIDGYFQLLKTIESPDVEFYFANKKTHKSKRVNQDWPKMLKATAFLVIYNLVESAIREGLGAIYEQVKSDGLACEALNEKLQRVWIDQQYFDIDYFSASPKTFQEKAHAIVESVLSKTTAEMTKSKMAISGNIDAKQVFRVCKDHGIPSKSHRAAKGAQDLEVVKTQRNALAHGDVSFSDCGRQYAVADLERIKNEAVIFLRSILRNIRTYSRRKRYASS